MILKQFYLECLSHASYLVADDNSNRAIIVDPRRDIGDYLDEAQRHDLRIEGVINTHFHADFVAGHHELVEATGAWIGFGKAANTDYPIRRLAPGEHISLGDVDIEILSTPGHTWESISLLVRETADGAPIAVLTGDSLFIGDVGRPDLANLGEGTNTDLARAMYTTIHRTLLQLPDDVHVLPAHGAGSACGKNMSTDLVSTIGEQRRTNPSVQPMSEAEFVELVTSGQPAIPGYFTTDAELNRRARTAPNTSQPLSELTTDQIHGRLTDTRTVVIDTRTPEEFAESHLFRTVNVGLAGRFAETCGMVADIGDDLVLVTAAGDEREAALRLSRIGYDNVVGFINTTSDPSTPFPEALAGFVEHTDRVQVDELAGLLEHAAVTVLDVRNPGEREAGFIEGSIHIPLPELATRHSSLPEDKLLVVHCRSGWRSSVAASLLRAHGHEGTIDLVGGYTAWEPTSTPAATCNAGS
jgi:glyoxylase-like metal-dependent hydrolase (beta-lactamase superfamily II)/rhodanese-related sulfurtransferase